MLSRTRFALLVLESRPSSSNAFSSVSAPALRKPARLSSQTKSSSLSLLGDRARGGEERSSISLTSASRCWRVCVSWWNLKIPNDGDGDTFGVAVFCILRFPVSALGVEVARASSALPSSGVEGGK